MRRAEDHQLIKMLWMPQPSRRARKCSNEQRQQQQQQPHQQEQVIGLLSTTFSILVFSLDHQAQQVRSKKFRNTHVC